MKVQSDSNFLMFTSYDTEQIFSDEDVKRMWEKYKVIYDPEGCFALRMFPKVKGNPLFQIVAEDDGCIKFVNNFNSGFVFDSGWAENIIDLIQRGIDFLDNEAEEASDNLLKAMADAAEKHKENENG